MIEDSPCRFIIIHRYFWPKNLPYAQMLKHIAQRASDDGFDVEVLTTHENNEDQNIRSEWESVVGVKVRSIKIAGGRKLSIFRKIVDAIYFGAWIYWRLLRSSPQLVMVATTPPIVMASIVKWASQIRGFSYIYHCQDIHPEAMKLNNYIDSGWIYRLLHMLDLSSINHATRVIVLSNDMKETLYERGCDTNHVRVINNFIYEPTEIKEYDFSGEKRAVRFLFAGTLGFFQNLDNLIDAISYFKGRSDVEFHFMGDGSCRRRIEKKAESMQLQNVHFLGQKTTQEAILAMAAADYGIVSIAPNITDVAYPSKTMMYLTTGLPLFAIVDKGAEIFHFISNNKLGITVPPNSASDIAESFELAVSLCKKKVFSRSEIADIADSYFGKSVILNKFSNVFLECKELMRKK